MRLMLPRAWICCLLIAAAMVSWAGAGSAQPGITISVELARLPGVDVTAPAGKEAAPGSTVNYLFWLQNTGSLTTSYGLSVTTPPGWSYSLPQHPNKHVRPLQPGEVEIVPVSVTLPSRVVVGTRGDTTLTATADEKPRPSDQDTVTTKVVAPPEVPRTVITPPGQSGSPGQTLVYPFQVKNIGTETVSFRVTASSSAKWATSLPDHPSGSVGPLAPGQVEAVPAAVQIPQKAEIGQTCNTTLKAIRLSTPRVRDEGTVTTVVVAPSTLSLALSLDRVSAESVIVRARIENTGPSARHVTVKGASVQGRTVTVNGGPTAEVTAAAGGAAEVLLAVGPAQLAGDDYLIVSATSDDDPTVSQQVLLLTGDTNLPPNAT